MKLVDLLTLPDMSVCLIENNGSIDSNLLFETERSIIKSKWSDVRKRTFTMGRIAAHEAMRKIGITSFAISKGIYEEPLWAEGIIGSISHKDDIAVAVVGHNINYKAIGIDIEDKTINLSEKECKLFCSLYELDSIYSEKDTPIGLFSKKEALFKAMYMAQNELYDFIDLNIYDDNIVKNTQYQVFEYGSFIVSLCIIL